MTDAERRDLTSTLQKLSLTALKRNQWTVSNSLRILWSTHSLCHFSYRKSIEVVKIRDSLQEWARWDVFKSLANYRVVVETLFDLLKNNLMQDLSENDHAEKLAQSLSQDVHALHDQLFSIFGDPDKYKIFLSSRGDLAQKLIDLLQDVLDSLPETTARTRLFKALLRLSRVSGLHPTCFALTGLYVTGRQVAAGGFSDIWKGQVRGKSVSVKIMRLIEASEARTALQEFGREALIWRQLSHPNLLPFLGLHYLDNKLCLVSPWMSNGHILQFLKTAPPDVDRVSLMLDVAMGLEYLHGRDVVHGDLKGTNILVTPSHRACVADFGLSTIVDAMTLRFSHSTASVNRGGTARYQSPELLSTPTPNHFGSDVYAYACVCYEIWTGKAPFFELPRDGTVIMKVVEGLRPSRPTTIPFNDSLWLLLQDCWKTEPRDRPSASQIVRRLLGPAIRAKARDSAKDWDETISSKCRRSLQDWPLLPSVASIERRVFGDGARSVWHCAENTWPTPAHSDALGASIYIYGGGRRPSEVAPPPALLRSAVSRSRAYSCSAVLVAARRPRLY
ncbi:Protein kinase domain-containing protein [Mycena sanguinolenta]|uniref:Protein kinase domain-containing protein n=1 Tax=Mycena sanguinolenta TaxID=230812 RepID=A0A8H7CUU7_9AGAR|nr:Protein kinase domain-containing protein [Mycena sanguinolenta]